MSARNYSVGELRDLIAAKDVDLSNEVAARAALHSAPDGTWDEQWASVQAAYQHARAAGERWISVTSLLGGDSDDATSEYGAVLSALNPSWETNTVALGSFDDLARRVIVAAAEQNAPLPTPQPLPQPSMQNDSGINPDSLLGYLTGAAAKVGLVSNPPPGTPGTPGAPPLIPTWLKVTAIVGVGVMAVNAVSNTMRYAATVASAARGR